MSSWPRACAGPSPPAARSPSWPRRGRDPAAAPRSGPAGRCWSGSGPGRRASPGRSRGAGLPGRPGRAARPPVGAACSCRACRACAAASRRPSTPGPARRCSERRLSRKRLRILSLPSRMSTCGSMMAERLVKRQQLLRLSAVVAAGAGASARGLELVGCLGALLLVPRGLRAGLLDEQLDLADLPGQEIDFAPGSLRDLEKRERQRFDGHGRLSPRASGSSPGAWRRRRPGCGRSR